MEGRQIFRGSMRVHFIKDWRPEGNVRVSVKAGKLRTLPNALACLAIADGCAVEVGLKAVEASPENKMLAVGENK